MKKEYDFSKGKRGPVIGHKGKTRITIWLDNTTVVWFRKKALREAHGYQTMINSALKEYIETDRLPFSGQLREAIDEAVRTHVNAALAGKVKSGIRAG